jgi:glutathione S-transferase
MLKVWGRTTSVNVQKVLWCCEELTLDIERVDLGGNFGGTETPEYQAMNPNGLVPAISEDGFILWESNTIVRYLSARHGAGTLWPENPAQRALADKWMDFQLGTLWPAFHDGYLGLTRVPPEKRDPKAIQTSLDATAETLAILDEHLTQNEYVSGDDLTMGDIALGSTIYRWLKIDIERPNLPGLEAWHERLTTRPAYQKTVMVPYTLPTSP